MSHRPPMVDLSIVPSNVGTVRRFPSEPSRFSLLWTLALIDLNTEHVLDCLDDRGEGSEYYLVRDIQGVNLVLSRTPYGTVVL